MRVPDIPYRQGRNRYGHTVKFGIAIHNTANDATAKDEAAYAARRTDGTSAHLYVDSDTVVQSLDTRERAGHAGSDEGNSYAIAVEIAGVNGWSREKWLRSVAWDELGAALAAIIRHHWPNGSFKVRRASVAEMRRNPKVKAFYGHDDMRRAWGGTDHTDPGPNFPWDRLFAAVNAALTPQEGDDMSWTEKLADTSSTVARFGKGPRQAKSYLQLGAIHAYDAARNAAAARLAAEAVLAKLAGGDTDAVIDRIDQLANQLGQQAAEEAQRDAELLALWRQHTDGTLDAQNTLRRIGEILTAASNNTPPQTGG